MFGLLPQDFLPPYEALLARNAAHSTRVSDKYIKYSVGWGCGVCTCPPLLCCGLVQRCCCSCCCAASGPSLHTCHWTRFALAAEAQGRITLPLLQFCVA